MKHAAWLAMALACRVEIGPPGGGGPDPTIGDTPSGEVWIYTSMYATVVEELERDLAVALPEVVPRFHRSGSEKIQQKLDAELLAGGTQACLVMTSDPFWYADLAQAGHLVPHLAPNVLQIDRSLVDPDARWVTARISLMVLAAHEAVVDPPKRLVDLADPRYRDRFSTGDPLTSGTNFSTLAFLQREQGWGFYEKLRDNGLIASGGNSSVLTRIEGREREIGVILLENLLAARAKHTPAKPIYPEDGAIAVPGPIALTATCPNPVAARAVYDFILSEPGQRAMIDGQMYAALPSLPPPDGAPPLSEIVVRPWAPGFLDDVRHGSDDLKNRYQALMADR